MLTTLFAALAVLLSLGLPAFPQGLTPPITLFLLLITAAGLGGLLRSRASRALLAVVTPWGVALVLALLVGSLYGNRPIQMLEDSLTYIMFALALCAGRGAKYPAWVLVAVLITALGDAAGSIAAMPSYDLSKVRSTYNYLKIITGDPLIGIFCIALLYRLTSEYRRRRLKFPSAPDLSPRAGVFLHRHPWLTGGLLALLTVSVVATVSRGMMLSLLIGLMVALYLRRPARGLSVTFFLVVGGILFASTALEFGEVYLRFGTLETVTGRLREVQHCLEVFAAHPIVGVGLGAEFVVDGQVASFVHNMLAYHLWKFGLLGSGLLCIPLWGLARMTRRAPAPLRATALGGAVSMLAYLVTCASYKHYSVVPMLGLTVGASLALLAQAQRHKAMLHRGSSTTNS